MPVGHALPLTFYAKLQKILQRSADSTREILRSRPWRHFPPNAQVQTDLNLGTELDTIDLDFDVDDECDDCGLVNPSSSTPLKITTIPDAAPAQRHLRNILQYPAGDGQEEGSSTQTQAHSTPVVGVLHPHFKRCSDIPQSLSCDAIDPPPPSSPGGS